MRWSLCSGQTLLLYHRKCRVVPTMLWIVKFNFYLQIDALLLGRLSSAVFVLPPLWWVRIHLSHFQKLVCALKNCVSWRCIVKNYSGFTEVRWMYLCLTQKQKHSHWSTFFNGFIWLTAFFGCVWGNVKTAIPARHIYVAYWFLKDLIL